MLRFVVLFALAMTAAFAAFDALTGGESVAFYSGLIGIAFGA